MNNNKLLTEGKKFKKQMGVCSIITFIASLLSFFLIPCDDKTTTIFVLIASIIFGCLYFDMKSKIKKLEKIYKDYEDQL